MHPLQICLPPAVELRIMEFKSRGGPLPVDFEQIRSTGLLLSEHGDNLLYRSSKPGESADLFNRLAHALAVMAYVPGGVTFCGVHYEVKRNG
jgi:hypothetical protein